LHTGAAADRRLAEHRAPVALDPPEPDCQPQTIADQPAAIEWFATEHACLVAAQELAAARQLLARVWQLAWVASTFHGWQGRIYDALEPRGWQQARHGEHEHARANSEQAVARHREHGNREGEANALHSLGFIAHHAGRLAAALDCYHEALAVCRELGDAMQEA